MNPSIHIHVELYCTLYAFLESNSAAQRRYVIQWPTRSDLARVKSAIFKAVQYLSLPRMLAVRSRVASRALFATRGFAFTARTLSDELPKPPRPIDDSTSALDYKTSHKVRPPPLPKMDLPRSRSAEEAVTNILYNTPPPSLQPYKK